MEISEHGIAFVAGWEGGRSSDGLYHAYWDPFGHVWTIGVGETEGVHQGMVWTQAQAFADLRMRMSSEYEPHIPNAGLNQNQWDAICSFIWNVGPGSMQWDVGRALRAREFKLAADLLLEYDRAGGQVLAGLANRRRAERALFLTPVKANRYARFDKMVRVLPNGGKASEDATAREYDEKRRHPVLHRRRLRRLRDNAGFLAQRIEEVQHQDPGSGEKFNRPWRRRELEGREAGRRYI